MDLNTEFWVGKYLSKNIAYTLVLIKKCQVESITIEK